jgi:hypothetical protein
MGFWAHPATCVAGPGYPLQPKRIAFWFVNQKNIAKKAQKRLTPGNIF